MFTSYAEGTNLKVVMVAGQKSFAAEEASLSEHRCVHCCNNGRASEALQETFYILLHKGISGSGCSNVRHVQGVCSSVEMSQSTFNKALYLLHSFEVIVLY